MEHKSLSSPAFLYAMESLKKIVSYYQTPEKVQESMLSLLSVILTKDSVYPQMSSGGFDNSLFAEWILGKQRLGIGTHPDGSYSLISTTDSGLVRYNEVWEQQPNINFLKALVEEFTAAVNQVNPNWVERFMNNK